MLDRIGLLNAQNEPLSTVHVGTSAFQVNWSVTLAILERGFTLCSQNRPMNPCPVFEIVRRERGENIKDFMVSSQTLAIDNSTCYKQNFGAMCHSYTSCTTHTIFLANRANTRHGTERLTSVGFGHQPS